MWKSKPKYKKMACYYAGFAANILNQKPYACIKFLGSDSSKSLGILFVKIYIFFLIHTFNYVNNYLFWIKLILK